MKNRVLAALAAIGVSTAVPLGLGVWANACTPAQGAEVLQVLQEVESWASAFLAGVQALWPFIQPIIPIAQQAQVTNAYNNAIATLGVALAGAENDVASAVSGATISADIAAIEAAVGQLDAIYQIWAGGNDAGGATAVAVPIIEKAGSLHALAVRIQAVRP